MDTNNLEKSVEKLSLSKSTQPCGIRTLPFYVSLPCDIEFDTLGTIDENNDAKSSVVGVVGTITILRTSIMVWIGWSANSMDEDEKGMISSIGSVTEIKRRDKSNNPIMGPLAIAMPRTTYNKNPQQATSQLIGGDSEEDQMLGHQISCRLSKKLNCPVLVSCSLSISRNVIGGAFVADEFIAHRAAAFAEKEIGRLVLKEGL